MTVTMTPGDVVFDELIAVRDDDDFFHWAGFNRRLIRRAAYAIAATPERYDQSLWFSAPTGADAAEMVPLDVCNTRACVFGHIVGEAGYDFVYMGDRDWLAHSRGGEPDELFDIGDLTLDLLTDDSDVRDELTYISRGSWCAGHTVSQVVTRLLHIADARSREELGSLITGGFSVYRHRREMQRFLEWHTQDPF